MLITIENKYGKTLSEIANTKRRFVSSYAKFSKEIFGVNIDEQLTLENTSCGVSNMENHFLGLLNNSLKEKGSKIRLSSLETGIKEQVRNHFMSELKDTIIGILEDSIDFLCSQTKMSEEKVKEYFISEGLTAAEKEMKVEDIESCNIDYLLELEKQLKEESEKEAAELMDIIEEQKKSVKQENKEEKTQTSKQEESKSEAKVKASDNFVPKQEVVDVDYENISTLNNSDKSELKKRVSECYNFYTNKDRLIMMLGANANKAQEVLAKVVEKIQLMDEAITDDKSKEEISSTLSQMQIGLIDMINSYNPAVKSTLNIMDLFKDVEVGPTGEPVRVEDFFGKQYEAEELVEENNIIDKVISNNTTLLNKFKSKPLYDTINIIQQQTGTLLKLEEVKAPYKEISSIIKVTPVIKDTEINRYFYIDIAGSLYLDKPKFIILNKSDIIEDGYYLDIDRVDLIVKYIYGTISEQELVSNDLINPRLRSLNKTIDISSIHNKNKQLISEILLEEKSKELLNKAVELDKECRFRLEEITAKTFTMISDSKTKSHFTGQTCKRKKMRLSYDINKAELVLDEKIK